MARALKPPSNLPSLVKTAFAKARLSGDLHYFPTQVTLLSVNSVPFQLRFSPALANKPKAPQDQSSPKPPFDPFANPPAALYIADVGPLHYLVLNKFAIVPEHFILATRDFKEQTDVLEASDLEATLACIEAYENANHGAGDGLFAFFNCGEHSGASQPHRHIQLLPIAMMREGIETGEAWDVLADGPDLTGTPFVVFSDKIRQGMSGAELHDIYVRLYRQACRAVDERNGTPVRDVPVRDVPVRDVPVRDVPVRDVPAREAPATGPTRISYNMAMTKNRLVVCPRLSEGGSVHDKNGKVVGKVALNGTVLAGTALVKNEAEWDALRENPSRLVDVLKRIGLSREEYNEDSANKL